MEIFLSVKPSPADLAGLFESDSPVVFAPAWHLVAEHERHHNVVVVSENPSEFPIGLEFRPQSNDEEEQDIWLIIVARRLSQKLRCRTLFLGNPVEPEHPYLDVVFDCGLAFLADDMDSVWANEGDGPIRIIERLPQWDCPMQGLK